MPAFRSAPSAASFFCCALINSSNAWISWSRALPLGGGVSTGPSIEIWAKDLSCLPAWATEAKTSSRSIFDCFGSARAWTAVCGLVGGLFVQEKIECDSLGD